MKAFLKILSATGLILTLAPSFMVFSGVITLDMDKWLMLLGTIMWFVTAPFWMNKKVEQ
jgi:hypothetical protein